MNVPELAEALGISRNSVTNYERGHTTPNRAVLIADESVTGVPRWRIEAGDDERAVTQR